jgi:septal ring factor EnvC (AmiA/AmiB activator)
MTSPRWVLFLAIPALCCAPWASAQAPAPLSYDDAGAVRQALAEARSQAGKADSRARRLEAEAAAAGEAAERTARESAAVAARVQQVQAEIAVHRARIGLIEAQRRVLRARLAERQQPLVRLTGALQRLSRQPVALAMLRPGSLRDAMHMRALIETILPEVERRTRALKAELARAKALQLAADKAARDLVLSQRRLGERRQALAALETRQRLAARDAGGIADRESERALALAERARDLSGLVAEVGKAGALREALAALPGPVMRPPRPEAAQVVDAAATPSPAAGLAGFALPVDGRLVAGFGAVSPGKAASRGIAIAPLGGAQAVAPAAGRVAYAGPYRGYGNIVIIEHPGGWTSLVTGLAQLDVRVGRELVGGAPLGTAGPGRPVIGLELRRGGEPVNPLDLLRG